MMKLLFSAQGRLNRKQYWLAAIGWAAAFIVVGGAATLVGTKAGDNPSGGVTAAIVLLSILLFVMMLASIWSTICLGIKRYHDLGKPGVWVLMAYVPIVGWLWYFIEAGCTRGVVGPNLYGPDPLGGPTSFGAPLPAGAA